MTGSRPSIEAILNAFGEELLGDGDSRKLASNESISVNLSKNSFFDHGSTDARGGVWDLFIFLHNRLNGASLSCEGKEN